MLDPGGGRGRGHAHATDGISHLGGFFGHLMLLFLNASDSTTGLVAGKRTGLGWLRFEAAEPVGARHRAKDQDGI